MPFLQLSGLQASAATPPTRSKRLGACSYERAKGPAGTFTGDVWIDPITRGLPPSQLNVAAVRFTPGARTAWHSHGGGQTGSLGRARA